MNNVKIYNLKQIEGACVIGSPIVAGILIAHNYKALGNIKKGVLWIFIGILWTLALISIAMIIPENISKSAGMVIPFLNGAILYPIINRLQGDQIKEHFENNGEKGSIWLPIGLTILVAALILTPTILLNRISPINDYTRQPFNSNGIYYNNKMPIDEVNKLGGILQRVEYFNPKSQAEVVSLSTDTTYEFKLITEKSFFNDTAFINETKQIFKHLDRYQFKKSLTFKITDPYLKDDKIIVLDKIENIPTLLEAELFSKNPNFKLIYDMSIVKDERDKFQNLILEMDKIFPTQNRFDFYMDFEDGNYFLRLFIPKQSWENSQLLSETRFIKQRLNNYDFKYPFKLLFVDNSTIEVHEKEIE